MNTFEIKSETENGYGGRSITVDAGGTELTILVADEADAEQARLLVASVNHMRGLADVSGALREQERSLEEAANASDEDDEEEPLEPLSDADVLVMATNRVTETYKAVAAVAASAEVGVSTAAAMIQEGGPGAAVPEPPQRDPETGRTPMMSGGGFVAANWTPSSVGRLQPEWSGETCTQCYNEVQHRIRTAGPELVQDMFEGLVQKWARENAHRIELAEQAEPTYDTPGM